MTTSNPPVAEFRMLINGELRPSSSGRTFDNVDPMTEEVIGVTADGTSEDFAAAVAAARQAFDTSDWSRDKKFRAHCLRQLHAALERHKEEIRPLLISEVGTARWLTGDTLFDVPIERVADHARYAEEYPYETELPELDFRGVVSRRFKRMEPVGVVAVISPWNGPWSCNLIGSSAALCVGNTVVLKPSPDAPWAATILGRLVAEETDIPAGVLNVVTSANNLMGEILTTDPRVDMISFTGSAANGRRIAEVSARTLKRLLLELGGKSPYVVLESADVAAESATAARLICVNAGQGCVARSRLLIPQSRYEEGVAAAVDAMKRVVIGDPRDPETFMGPLISARHRARVMDLIRRANEQGSHLAYGGGIPKECPRGYFLEPTLFVDVKPDDLIAQEEAFGPVLAAIPYADKQDALAIANNSQYGLSATVSAGSDEEALEFAAGLRTGTVSINGGVWMNLDVPFGGYKQSGLGRQFGTEGLAPYLETKVHGVRLDKPSTTRAW